ncbi:hypothetical protein K435DRAFT_853654 [Dendrothele bispora CBS 962.96]|uniref:Uncharacterized protein n=1 Tax=Dendrothele bispora (strain CBS 962.96) TaxID=1314807 RepID=A0A4V4HH70_DENBC|nr:hypothetical protein K435DRAFT_853654 [Dendrothele bispora CBS 962.96]
MFSYANGVTAEHYRYHFQAVIESIAEAASEHGVLITDEMFAQVVDFSDAQRLGFIAAFEAFFLHHDTDNRTQQQLRVNK